MFHICRKDLRSPKSMLMHERDPEHNQDERQTPLSKEHRKYITVLQFLLVGFSNIDTTQSDRSRRLTNNVFHFRFWIGLSNTHQNQVGIAGSSQAPRSLRHHAQSISPHKWPTSDNDRFTSWKFLISFRRRWQAQWPGIGPMQAAQR